MKKALLFKIIGAENLKYKEHFNIFRIFLVLILLLCQSFVFAQDSITNAKKEQPNIVMTNGAYIYSTDENFNKQILNNEVNLKNGELTYHQSDKNSKVIIKSVADAANKKEPFQNQFKNTVKKKKKETNSIDKRIKEFEKQKKDFQSQQFNPDPFTGKFLAGHQIFKDYITPPYHHDYSKMVNRYHRILITLALDYLHSQKYIQYNNKSLDHCFSKVFSVRPPPHTLFS
ncbi:hypothetical protein N0B16_13695 [Chryseobacterium sp. GMJ5]|uniref:Uncharacterized protein n=1 Tax=Chryseobacterium gilvum TaxID=2976534 RepID=A0ABT2VZX8_9FLAO|nr:hypothetical protein [Chryseobacterium gilvum]MCU7615486.1 hypothetical protein [Chryseobacterium gilvum]